MAYYETEEDEIEGCFNNECAELIGIFDNVTLLDFNLTEIQKRILRLDNLRLRKSIILEKQKIEDFNEELSEFKIEVQEEFKKLYDEMSSLKKN